ncbi:MerR family transcriptional regulator, partial [Blautia sp.]|uniref:MerR family transcriptional regulator n=2 Tax=Lachnospiraceae TaxID=186803 RepID=UPI003A8DC35F
LWKLYKTGTDSDMKSFQTVRKVRGSAMKIKQVEELVGITRKNIRFYEDQGLLNVERAENGYREYHQEDVIRLQEIKLFRKMDISIEEMKLLFEKKKSLQICLEQHLKELEHRKEGLLKMQDMCERLILEHRSLESLNAEDCLEEIEQMEKEGAKFMNVNKTDVHKKKRTGAIIGAAVMTVLMLVTIIIVFWANAQDPIPLGLLLLIAGIPAVIIAGTLIALAGRMKEIEGGEEDEASKY